MRPVPDETLRLYAICLYTMFVWHTLRLLQTGHRPCKILLNQKAMYQTKNCKQLLAFHVQMPKENANLISFLSRNSPFFSLLALRLADFLRSGPV